VLGRLALELLRCWPSSVSPRLLLGTEIGDLHARLYPAVVMLCAVRAG